MKDSNKFLLSVGDLQTFADNGEAGGEDNQAGQNQDESQGSDNAGQQGNDDSQQKQQKENFIPKSRFDEINNKNKELQDQIDKINKSKTQADLDSKKKNGEFENLYNDTHNELETTKEQYSKTSERVSQLEGLIQVMVDAEMENVPEDLRDLVPENFTAEQKLSWITNAKKKGLFGAIKNEKEEKELGGSTNNQQQQSEQTDVGKMSVTQLFKSAYGK